MLHREPKPGERIRWPDWKSTRYAIVQSVEGSLCHILEPDKPVRDGWNPAPFIWSFRDGTLNKLAINLDDANAAEIQP